MKPNQTPQTSTSQPLSVVTSRGWMCLLCLSALLLSHCKSMPSTPTVGRLRNQPKFSVLHEEKPKIFPLLERLPHPDSSAVADTTRGSKDEDLSELEQIARRIRRNLDLFGKQSLTPPTMAENTPSTVLEAITGVLVSDEEADAMRKAEALIAQSIQAIMNPAANPPTIQRVSVALAPPPSNPQAGEEALHLLTQRARETIEKTLGEPLVHVTILPQLWHPVPRRGVVRYRKGTQLKAALLLAQLLPRAQQVQPMAPGERQRLDEDMLVILSDLP